MDTLSRPYESAVAVNERRRMIGIALPTAFPAPEDRLAFAIASVPVPAVRTRLTALWRRDGNCIYASLGALSGQYLPKCRQPGQCQFPVQPGLAVAPLAERIMLLTFFRSTAIATGWTESRCAMACSLNWLWRSALGSLAQLPQVVGHERLRLSVSRPPGGHRHAIYEIL